MSDIKETREERGEEGEEREERKRERERDAVAQGRDNLQGWAGEV